MTRQLLPAAGAAPALTPRYLMPHRLDEGIAHRAAIGLVALASDPTIEHEWRRLLDLEGVSFFVSRISNVADCTPENLLAMQDRISDGAARLLPGRPLNVVAYGCTSATTLMGEDTVARLIAAGKPGARWTSPISAAKAAIQALGVGRIALLTPYMESIDRAIVAHLEAAGIQVPVMGSFNLFDDYQVCRITLESLRTAVLELGSSPQVEAVFVACTTVRGAVLIEELEATLGKPVFTSCHATAWHALRLAGVDDPLVGRGRLYQVGLIGG